jgi:hypothetical protein
MNPIVKEAQALLNPEDRLYDMVSEGDYEYLIEEKNCKTGQDFINELKKMFKSMHEYFFVNALINSINRHK